MKRRAIVLSTAFALLVAAAGQAGGAPALAWSLFMKGAAATIVVPRDLPTIQAAVDAAAPGDTITVRSGTDTEEVVIGKDLNLKAAGVGATVMRSPATLTP
jgi:nitrous oxidase accessory protein NosD